MKELERESWTTEIVKVTSEPDFETPQLQIYMANGLDALSTIIITGSKAALQAALSNTGSGWTQKHVLVQTWDWELNDGVSIWYYTTAEAANTLSTLKDMPLS